MSTDVDNQDNTDTNSETSAAESKLVRDLRKQLESKNEIIKTYSEKERVSSVWDYLTKELGVNNPKVKDILPKDITTEDADSIKTWFESNKDVITFTVNTNSADQGNEGTAAGLSPEQQTILAGASNVSNLQSANNALSSTKDKILQEIEAVQKSKATSNEKRMAIAKLIKALDN